MNRYLLTGATGVVGTATVRELVERGDSEVYVLLRARDEEHARARLDQLIAFLSLPADHALRVRPLIGDVSMPRLGLDASDYGQLAERVTHVIHAAGVVRMNLPIDEARRVAIKGAEHVLMLAEDARLRGRLSKLEFVSTVGVGGRRRAPLPETWLNEPRSFHNTYEQAKAEAEELVQAAAFRGLPVTVHRPSMVVGDSRTGRARAFQIFYHLLEFLSGRKSFGFQPGLMDRCVDIVPVDFVAKAIVWASRMPQTAGSILNLASGAKGALPLERLRATARSAFEEFGVAVPRQRVLPAPALARLVRLASALPLPQKRALATFPVFLEYLATHQVFENKATLATLSAGGVTLPDVGTYLDTIVRAYLNQRYRTEASVGPADDE